MFADDTPSSVLYQDLKSFGGISNKEAAQFLLSDKVTVGNHAPRERISERTFLSREVVHARPGQVNVSLFGDLSNASLNLLSRMLKGSKHLTRDDVRSHYLGEGAQAMRDILDRYGLGTEVYENEVSRLAHVRLRRENDRAVLALMLFVSAGCLASAPAAVATVEKFAKRTLAMDIGTIETGMSPKMAPAQQAVERSIGLLRIVNGAARPPIHTLSPLGSTVGSLASGPGAVTDVDVDVSRRHLRIWQEDGRWLCQGLGSTNGTVLLSGADKSMKVVEPPKSERCGTCPPVELGLGDILILGRTTRFLVMGIQAGS